MKKKIAAAAAVMGALASTVVFAPPASAGDSQIMKYQWSYPAAYEYDCYSDGQWYVQTGGFVRFECRPTTWTWELWAVTR
ncbi:hypothetical protein [Amycolatopsis kentuckyensis]|uniref:hypothetical protein n=1 Tax=Amycolatopsis kentuckyensis TaxID=218823 RepID=UPI000A39B9FB|nr:hypothetical protein [Amycolatopsis kentuckyensis]